MNRGANKKSVYDFPELKADQPTRLGIDEVTNEGWRKRNFWSVTHRRDKKSILDMVLAQPDPGIYKGHEFKPDEGRVCTSLDDDHRFFRKDPHGHMPYGFPELTMMEHKAITKWLDNGAFGVAPENEQLLRMSFHKDGPATLKMWEKYLNEPSFKSRLRSRYIYEHLFLAMLSFDNLPGEHYRLVRARNESEEPVEIPTVRPFDSAGDKFYYRFKKNIRTVMDKTNLPYHLNAKRLARWKQIFDARELLSGKDEFPIYGDKASNAFFSFKRIHPRARYEFLLDNAYYHIMTFIKGPVCRGQTALNVINDHFWVVFRDPSDKTLDDRGLQEVFAKHMYPPASANDKIESFDKFKEGFWESLKAKYTSYKKNNLSMNPESIWDGDSDHNKSALLTIYRHNDSAQVLQGAWGGVPKTVWILDYHVLEDIYYNLVAGYNVYGPYLHQINTRLYMEISRISSEDLFLTMIKEKSRQDLRSSWNVEIPSDKKSSIIKVSELIAGSTDYKMTFKYPFLGNEIKTEDTQETVKGVMDLIFEKRLNPKHYMTYDVLNRSQKNEFADRQGPFVKFFPDSTLIMAKGKIYTIIRNRFHYNVAMMFFESNRTNPENDKLDFVEGVATSYPNLYMISDKSIEEVGAEIAKVKTRKDFKNIVSAYGVSRHDTEFWTRNETFNKEAVRILGRDGGRFDLSRYGQY